MEFVSPIGSAFNIDWVMAHPHSAGWQLAPTSYQFILSLESSSLFPPSFFYIDCLKTYSLCFLIFFIFILLIFNLFIDFCLLSFFLFKIFFAFLSFLFIYLFIYLFIFQFSLVSVSPHFLPALCFYPLGLFLI